MHAGIRQVVQGSDKTQNWPRKFWLNRKRVSYNLCKRGALLQFLLCTLDHANQFNSKIQQNFQRHHFIVQSKCCCITSYKRDFTHVAVMMQKLETKVCFQIAREILYSSVSEQPSYVSLAWKSEKTTYNNQHAVILGMTLIHTR